jgi:hypothetical protein
LRRGECGRKLREAVDAASGNTAMLEGALLVVGRVKRDADEQKRDGKHDNANNDVHL